MQRSHQISNTALVLSHLRHNVLLFMIDSSPVKYQGDLPRFLVSTIIETLLDVVIIDIDRIIGWMTDDFDFALVIYSYL